ncbi:MAG: MBL fold metallo-hydrolase [Planctomycetota bacterium]
MILEQYYLGCLSQASYLVGDEERGIAAIVDPRRDVDLYLAEAEKRGLAIRHVVLTHFHADFVSGHVELRERTGATIHLGAAGKAEYAFEPLADGDELRLGNVRLRTLATPGHTPEAISLLVFDDARDAERPHAVLTGDTLFIGDVGRPDLMSSVGVTAEELGGMLYDSLRGKLMTLPDETLVYPGHGAGSMCGKNLSTDTVSTIGDQKRFNYALQDMGREEFVALVAANQPRAPRYFGFDAQLNRSERSTLDAALKGLRAMSVEELRAAAADGAVVVDVRDAEAFAAGHLAGAVNIGLEGRFASWAGTVLDADARLVIVAPEGFERETALRLGRIGYDGVIGFLAGGPDAVPADQRASTPRFDAGALSRSLEAAGGPLLLDVRQPGERANLAIEGSVHIPLGELEERAGELPKDRAVAIHCASGYRSMVAASLLARAGFGEVSDLAGGIEAWSAAELPTVSAEGAGCG